MPGIGLAAPANEEGLGGGLRLVNPLLRDFGKFGAARGPGDEREQLRAGPADVLACLLGGDVEQRAQAPACAKRSDTALRVHPHVTGADWEVHRLGWRQAREERVVDEQSPDVPEGHVADEFLDVHSPVAERPAFLVRLCDLGLERHNAFESRLEIGHRASL